MNYAVAGAMAGKSLGRQLAIATSYQALTSGNDSSKSPDWLAMDIATKGISVGMSFGTTKALNNLGFGKTWPVFFGDFIGNYMENYNTIINLI
ncbi:hypothetical protein A1D23_00535 [Chelonobacter oris]|uniref:hypothetical protein n=1 Tax=Chelonobacter oris TaxID=505317 RepID=UPI00244AE58F|nr:hypothetical protein [Chelonobacter oris]MDH3000051.1 hypothetical protein [Chelonobacter oris]